MIRLVVPRIKRILNRLLPTILPMARSAFPFLAAVTEVISSGREVPNATIVRPITLSDTPKIPAIVEAPLTTKRLPRIIAARPALNHFAFLFLCFMILRIPEEVSKIGNKENQKDNSGKPCK